jgi:hypothetical protein
MLCQHFFSVNQRKKAPAPGQDKSTGIAPDLPKLSAFTQ